MATHTNTYVMGRGRLYFDPFDANDATTGERYLGNTPGFELTIESEVVEHFNADSGVREKDDSVTIEVNRNATITCDNISNENLALFIIGDVSTVSQTGASVTDEAITVQTGRYYQLGVSSSNPTGRRGISTVVVQDDTDTTTYVEDTDYEVDATLGRLYIIPGGSIADDDVLHVDYAYATNSRTQIASNSTQSTDGALRYVADNAKGTNRDLYIPSCELRPEGGFQMKTENEWQALGFAIEFNKKDTSTEQLYIDGRAA